MIRTNSKESKEKGPAADFFEEPRKTGWLTKLGGTGITANWRRRYVVLDHHYLFYYRTDKDRAPAGIVCLPDYDIVAKADAKECKKPNAFIITSSDNIVPGGGTGLKRVYYMFTDSEEESEGWIRSIKEEMIAMVDSEQKHYFSMDQMRAETNKQIGTCAIDASAFDDLATIVDDVPKLEHVTTTRPKKPYTRAPSRGQKEFATFDEDDINSFALSPITEEDGIAQFGKQKLKKQRSSPASTQIRPIKPIIPLTMDTSSCFQEKPITKPKPPAKPKTAVKPMNLSETITLPVTNPEARPPLPAEFRHSEYRNSEYRNSEYRNSEFRNSEFIQDPPKPVPRRKAPSTPDITKDLVINLEPPSLQTELQSHLPPNTSPLPPNTSPPPPNTSPPPPNTSPPPPNTSPPPTNQNRVSISSSGSSHRCSVGTNPDTADIDLLRSSHSNRDSLSSNGSSSGNSDNVYQVPNNDPIYQIPRSSPVQKQVVETDIPKLPLQRLHSVGQSITGSPKSSSDLLEYSNIVTGYLCSSPQNLNTPPASPTNLMDSRFQTRANSLPRSGKNGNSLEPANDFTGRRLSANSSPNHPRPPRSVSPLMMNNNMTEQEVSDRLLCQIRELEDQLSTLTSISPQRDGTPLNQSKPLSHVLHTDTQRLIGQMKSVVLEAIRFHQQASEELQKARTEHKLAEKERREAATHTQAIQKLLSSVQPNHNSNY